MSLSTADLGSVCVASGPTWVNLKHPNRTTLYLLYTSLCTGELDAIRKHECFLCSPFYGRVCRWAMLGELKPEGPTGSPQGPPVGSSPQRPPEGGGWGANPPTPNLLTIHWPSAGAPGGWGGSIHKCGLPLHLSKGPHLGLPTLFCFYVLDVPIL